MQRTKGLHKRAGQSRGLFILKGIFLSLILLASLFLYHFLSSEILKDENLPVQKVRVHGAVRQVENKEIANLVGEMAGNTNIASLNLDRLHNAILQMPWVAQVKVQKYLPDTILIDIVEHVASAYWNDNGLYDAKEQKVFYPSLENFATPLVKLSGQHDDQAPLIYDYAVQFIPILQSAHLQMVALTLDSIGSFSLRLDNDVEIVIGRDDENNIVLKRLRRFVKAYKQIHLDLTQIKYIDLRYDVGFALGNAKIAQ